MAIVVFSFSHGSLARPINLFEKHAGEMGFVSNYCITLPDNLRSWCHVLSSDDDTSPNTITGNRIVMVSKQTKGDQLYWDMVEAKEKD